MKRNRKQNIRLLALILILLLGIGFAALAANLKIDGTLNVSRTSWDVHFENVSITEGSVTANPAPTSDDTTTTEMTYTINFTKPGDYFEFTTDIVNDGTIDAMVDVVSNNAYANAASTTPITLPTYLTSTVTYSDGVEILPNQELLHGTSETIKVRVEFKKDINVSDLPSSGDTSIVFKFKGDYKQKDENAISYDIYNPGDLVYFDPVTQENCNENTFDLSAVNNGTSTCYKWRVIKANDKSSRKSISIQMDHNLINESTWSTGDRMTTGPDVIFSTLASATSAWTTDNLNYSYDTTAAVNNYGILNCVNGTCTITSNNNTIATNVKARIITGEEVAALTVSAGAAADSRAANWNLGLVYFDGWYAFSTDERIIGTNQEGTGSKELSWLLENTTNLEQYWHSGATDNLYGENNRGYWSMSPVSDTDYPCDIAWTVPIFGFFSRYGITSSPDFGIRPVIEIEKTKLN